MVFELFLRPRLRFLLCLLTPLGFFCFRFTRVRSLRWERAAAATIAAVAATTAAADAEAIAVSAAAASGDAAALKGSFLLSCALLF